MFYVASNKLNFVTHPSPPIQLIHPSPDCLHYSPKLIFLKLPVNQISLIQCSALVFPNDSIMVTQGCPTISPLDLKDTRAQGKQEGSFQREKLVLDGFILEETFVFARLFSLNLLIGRKVRVWVCVFSESILRLFPWSQHPNTHTI